MGRMELRLRTAGHILGTAFRACIAAKWIFLIIALISAYESAIQRYAGLTSSTGKSLQLSVEPEMVRDTDLFKIFPFSISFSFKDDDLAKQGSDQSVQSIRNGQSMFAQDQSVSANPSGQDSNSAPSAQDSSNPSEFSQETPSGGESEEDVGLPRLRIKYVGNDTKVASAPEMDSLSQFSSPRFTGDRNRGPSLGVNVILIALSVIVVFLLAFLLMVSMQQAVTLAVLGYAVTCSYLGKQVRIENAISSGLKSGILRLMWLTCLHGIFHGMHSVVLSFILLRGVADNDSLITRLSSMPFAFLAPWRDERIIESGLSGKVGMFLFVDYLLEGVGSAVYIVSCWVVIMERGFKGMDVIYRGWHLLRSVPLLAIQLKVLESLVCGRSLRWSIEQVLGGYGTIVFTVTADVYFWVVWLVFYLSVRARNEAQFGHRDLEEYMDRVR